MNVRDSEFDRLLAGWLEDDAFVAPASPVEAAVDFARNHPRRRDWLAFARRDAMTARATTGLRPVAVFAAVAAVLLIGAASVALIGSLPVETARPTTTATAAPTAIASTPPASPSVTPVAVLPLPRTGSVMAGTYRVEFPDSPVTVDLTLEDRWKAGSSFTEQGAAEPWNVQYLLDAGDFSHTIWFYTVGNVNTDGCDWEGTQPDPPIGPTVDDFVAALDAQQNTDLSNPVDVVLDGYAGKRVDMRVSERGDCRPNEGRPPLVMWVRPNGQPGAPLVFDPVTPSFITVWILDVDGHRVVVDTYLNPAFKAGLGEAAHVEAMAQAEAEVLAVMDSMEFAVNQDGQ
jgi:hypothetical protein